MTENKPSCPWQDKIINPRVLGGIDTAVLDNGPARGSRVAWINTGSGLRYRVQPLGEWRSLDEIRNLVYA